jgi:hypothetical protein
MRKQGVAEAVNGKYIQSIIAKGCGQAIGRVSMESVMQAVSKFLYIWANSRQTCMTCPLLN